MDADQPPRLDLRTRALAVVGVVVVVALVGAVIALIRGRSVSGGVALAYYLAGSVIILAGSAPRGGFSMLRGRWSTRRPTGGGGYALEGILLGLLLIGVGVLVDVARPF